MLCLTSLLAACNLKKADETVSSVTYNCPSGNKMQATYITRPPTTGKDGRPVPEGSVRLSLNDGPETTLSQTIAASGIRFADKDEHLVFWSKGRDAFILRQGAIDPNFKECMAVDPA
ncbi:MAG: hypothetical protein EP348_07540 [Alphaproteobacteria bacterium]|nr:MAG: hypothetical protein EP348_07540 [Alphaproteobacteria bacterium]